MGHYNKFGKYIWQKSAWPNFTWSDSRILPILSLARKKQGLILAKASELGLEVQLRILTDDAQKTSAIEGEKLEVSSLRSSIARRLGIKNAGILPEQRNIEGLVEMLLDATKNFSAPLTEKRLKGWQAGLFPTGYSGIHEIVVGDWRTSSEPMRVISGRMGKEKIHFEAPPAKSLKNEMIGFINWFNKNSEVDGLIRAAIAHIWFITIHPFDDGNGRMARAISDLAISQDEALAIRCYSLSSQINADRKKYYEILEATQRGDLDITNWIIWFLETFIKAIDHSQIIINKTQSINDHWKRLSTADINSRQRKALQKMIEAEPEGFLGGMTNKKYVSINKVSSATAKRDLLDLEDKGLLKRNASKGRSFSYSLK